MFKMIFLVLGLAVGFGGGVYWANGHPDQAKQMSAEEEKQFLQAQLAITQKIQAKLDSLSNKTSSGKTAGSGFLSSSQAGAATASDVSDLKSDAQKQEADLRKRLNQLK
jgi:hypothetical protein